MSHDLAARRDLMVKLRDDAVERGMKALADYYHATVVQLSHQRMFEAYRKIQEQLRK